MAESRPFVGKTGLSMEKYLRDAGLTRDDVSIGNAIRCRWKGSNELPEIRSVVARDALRHCATAHLRVPEGTRLLVAQGDYAATQLTEGPVGEWRGYLRPFVGRPVQAMAEPWVPEDRDTPVLLTVHLARLFREPSLTLPTRLDWAKIPRILSGKWPRKPPQFRLTAPEEWPEVFAFDTEYWHEEDSAPTSARLTRWSASWGSGDGETCVVETGHAVPARSQLSNLSPRVITQYAPADVHHLARLTGLDWRDSVWDHFTIEDAVWKHSVLWSDSQHDLNYLASIYGSYNRHKHLSERDPILYSGLDALVLLEVDQALERELGADPASRRVWETIDRPALRSFVTAQYRGLRINPERVREVLAQADSAAADATLRAQAVAGWPISLASNPQVGHQLYAVEGHKPKR